jgi:predicted transcriptional regulator
MRLATSTKCLSSIFWQTLETLNPAGNTFGFMLLPAEIESKTLIPALRAILAKKLAEDHNVREEEISKMLGVTQAAVSNYIRGTRGDPALIAKLLSEEQVSNLIDELTENLSSDMAYTPSSLSKFIGLCNYIKSSLLICEIHHNLESDIDEKVCKECENMLLKGPGSVY